MTQSSKLKLEKLVEVGVYDSYKTANEYALVILSMRLPYWMFREEGQYYLCVEDAQVNVVVAQLEKYKNENLYVKPQVTLEDEEKTDLHIIAVYIMILITFYLGQLEEPQWYRDKGALDANAVIESGEWWRTVTALTLHADIGHLAANLAGGMFFGIFVSRLLGSGLGWFLIILSGMTGNALSAYVYYPTPHLAIGASTAIFGALGNLVGFSLFTRMHPFDTSDSRRRIMAFVGGICLLALLGAGGGNTDVIAHGCGFVAGILFGIGGLLIKKNISRSKNFQRILLISCLLILSLSWMTAVYR
jgi:rhomboid protease GluP